MFAGFALSLNGVSYLTKIDDRVKAIANILVGIVIGINAVFQTAAADSYITFGFSAAMWLFSLNYLIIAAHILLKAGDYKVFGLYSLFAFIVSAVFAGDTVVNDGPAVMVFLWGMWAVLWLQSFVSIMLGVKAVDKLTPHILILNGVVGTFVPGFLILLGVIL